MNTRSLLVVFHSQSGRAEKLALTAFKAARQEQGIDVVLRRAVDACAIDVLNASALIIVSPENFGSASGGIKDFFDRVYYPLENRLTGSLPYAMIISAGNDGSGCERQLDRILTGLKGRKIQASLFVQGIPDSEHLQQCHDVGGALAAGLAMGIF